MKFIKGIPIATTVMHSSSNDKGLTDSSSAVVRISYLSTEEKRSSSCVTNIPEPQTTTLLKLRKTPISQRLEKSHQIINYC